MKRSVVLVFTAVACLAALGQQSFNPQGFEVYLSSRSGNQFGELTNYHANKDKHLSAGEAETTVS